MFSTSVMPASGPMAIPDSHCDLLTGAVHGVLATMLPDGQPQCSVVWVDYDGTYMRLNTTLERQKGCNMRSNPRVSLLVVDPRDTSRWIEVRGRVVALRREGAEEHANELTRRYTGKERFYGDIYPVEQRRRETRVIALIEPLTVSLDAIFKRDGGARPGQRGPRLGDRSQRAGRDGPQPRPQRGPGNGRAGGGLPRLSLDHRRGRLHYLVTTFSPLVAEE